MQLTLPDGEQVNSLSWTVTGPNGASTVVKTGTADLSKTTSTNYNLNAPGIPPGSGYSVFLSGTSADGIEACAATATFDSKASAVTIVPVQLLCARGSPDAGSALINGKTFNCATWNSVTVSPTETTVGHFVSVSATAVAPNPSAITYAWSASSGTFDQPHASSANFTCTAAGTATLTLTVADGPVASTMACDASRATATVQVQCDAPSP
jgi:hypothetical protein